MNLLLKAVFIFWLLAILVSCRPPESQAGRWTIGATEYKMRRDGGGVVDEISLSLFEGGRSTDVPLVTLTVIKWSHGMDLGKAYIFCKNEELETIFFLEGVAPRSGLTPLVEIARFDRRQGLVFVARGEPISFHSGMNIFLSVDKNGKVTHIANP